MDRLNNFIDIKQKPGPNLCYTTVKRQILKTAKILFIYFFNTFKYSKLLYMRSDNGVFSSAAEQVEKDQDDVEVNEESSCDVLLRAQTVSHHQLHVRHQEQGEDQRPQRPVPHLRHV